MNWRVAAIAALAVGAASAPAFGGAANYGLAPTQSCLVHAGLKVSVEPPVQKSLQRLTPYGSLGGLDWKEAKFQDIFVEFGKSAAEVAVMKGAVVKLFGQKAADGAAVTKANVMFYTNHFKLTSHEISAVLGCLH